MIKSEVTVPDLIEQIQACCQALDDKKAENLQILHLGPRSSLTDYFVIATGTSEPHLRALRDAVEKSLAELNVEIMGVDRSTRSGWVVVDAYDFIVHLFTAEQRGFYNLEGLWKDAARLPVECAATGV